MPISSFAPSAKQALAVLKTQRTVSADQILRKLDAQRHSRLRQFLEQRSRAGSWQACCAALDDALLHGVAVSDDDVKETMTACATAGRADACNRIFFDTCRKLKVKKGVALEEHFFSCGAMTGDFLSLDRRLMTLMRRQQTLSSDEKSPSRSSLSGPLSGTPRISSALLCDYLTAAERHTALTAKHKSHAKTDDSSDTNKTLKGPSWSVALGRFVELRRNPQLRSLIELTPQVLERVSRLAEVGRQWATAVQLITAASQQSLLIPPESFDAAIRCCWRAEKHDVTVKLIEICLASRTPPDEASVRMGIRSAEAVAFGSSMTSLAATLPMSSGIVSRDSRGVGAPSSLLSVALHSHQWVLAVKLFQGLCDNGLPLVPQTFESPIRTCCASGQWAMAMKLVGEMKKDRRLVPTHVYRQILLSKMERCDSYDAARALFENPIVDKSNAMSYCSLLRCCISLQDWKNFRRVNDEMKRREIPESYEKMKLLMIAAFEQGQHHAVIARYVRWMQQTTFERERTLKDATAAAAAGASAGGAAWIHNEDFVMEDLLLKMVIDCCEHLRKSNQARDPAVDVAQQDATKRLFRGQALLSAASEKEGGGGSWEPWLLSQEVRERVFPSAQ